MHSRLVAAFAAWSLTASGSAGKSNEDLLQQIQAQLACLQSSIDNLKSTGAVKRVASRTRSTSNEEEINAPRMHNQQIRVVELEKHGRFYFVPVR